MGRGRRTNGRQRMVDMTMPATISISYLGFVRWKIRLKQR